MVLHASVLTNIGQLEKLDFHKHAKQAAQLCQLGSINPIARLRIWDVYYTHHAPMQIVCPVVNYALVME